MAKAKQVLDVRVSKGITTSQSNEHQRRWTEKGWEQALEKGNYDPSREHLNFEIVSGKVRPVDKSRSIPERMAEILDRRGIKDPNEGLDEPKYRTVVNIIFGGSRDRMRELAFGSQKVNFDKGADNSDVERKRDIERWAKDVYAFVSGRYGEQNIAAFIVHLDEINPHVHCTLLPKKRRPLCIQGDIRRKGQVRVQPADETASYRFFHRSQYEVGDVAGTERFRNGRPASHDRGVPPYAFGGVYDL